MPATFGATRAPIRCRSDDPGDDGARVLLLHGLATNCRSGRGASTDGSTSSKTKGGPCIAPDLLGHGRSAQPTDPSAYAGFEDHVIDQLPQHPVDAIGFSLGARTLLVVAAPHPERFHRLVVAGVGANLFRRDGSSAALADALEAGDSSDPLVSHFTQLARSCGQSIPALIALLRRPDAPVVDGELLRNVTHPTLVVLGSRDFAGPATPLVEALPLATLRELPGVDHFSTPKAMGFIDAALGHIEG